MSAQLSTDAVNLSIAILRREVDALGELNDQAKRIEARIEAIKATLIQSGINQLEGERYSVRAQNRRSSRLDLGLVKSVLSVRQLCDCTVESPSTAVYIKQLL